MISSNQQQDSLPGNIYCNKILFIIHELKTYFFNYYMIIVQSLVDSSIVLNWFSSNLQNNVMSTCFLENNSLVLLFYVLWAQIQGNKQTNNSIKLASIKSPKFFIFFKFYKDILHPNNKLQAAIVGHHNLCMFFLLILTNNQFNCLLIKTLIIYLKVTIIDCPTSIRTKLKIIPMDYAISNFVF